MTNLLRARRQLAFAQHAISSVREPYARDALLYLANALEEMLEAEKDASPAPPVNVCSESKP